ncbi:glycosyltransferase family protein [Pontibacter fetidus]|uniref:Glycosyltransferase family 1 protein n=1 Tax=Pontibacter fetidus TaxID=2700082 RepID=A0A6B2H795_9BACT|nr:glycosyltransferase family 1 protein [Pontibacter fetidus]NDK56307.1 glycosyltransferase family 1 protein [Pontibacter fetidus]
MLRNKTILLISPQPWGDIFVSKHHYAVELASRGNKVIFLNPPNANAPVSFNLLDVAANIQVLTFRPFFNISWRFKFRPVFDLLMRWQVNKVMNFLDHIIDVVWCFDPNIYSDLNWFGAKYNIFHPVDPIVYHYQVKPGNSADIIFSVSEKILSAYKGLTTPAYFINHGVSEVFAKLAKHNLTILQSGNYKIKQNQPIKVGYVGNLLRSEVDRPLLLHLIEKHKDVEFNLWGPYTFNNNNLAGANTNDTVLFIDKLKNAPNVILHGKVTGSDLATQISNMDVFLLLYNLAHGTSDRSNSHKILEYLSTGKVIVSYKIDTYLNYRHLLAFADEDTQESFSAKFEEVITSLDFWNKAELQEQRVGFVLHNRYTDQLDRICRVVLNKN